MTESNIIISPETQSLINFKDSGYEYRKPRHEDWRENFQLYHGKVVINRLTQRQSVHIPLMKQTIKTLLKDVDDMPVLYFENLDNDKQAEIFKNEYWKYTVEENRMELLDIVDKRQVFLYGRSFDQWQIVDGKIKMTVEDPMDILVDRYCDPTNLNSSRFLIHTHIFKPLSSLEHNELYDKAAIGRIKEFYKTDLGLVKAADNKEALTEKNQKLVDLGVGDVEDPILGETYVELNLYFVFRKEGDQDEEIYVYVICDDMEQLSKKTLEETLGVTKDHYWRTHYPYVTWGDDLERQYFWSDGVGDVVRPANQILDVWYSQLVENRTMRSFGMHYYNSSLTAEGFNPATFNPQAWGWYPVPGNPNEVLAKVDIPDLSESMDEINFLIGMNEKSTGASATQQGVQTERKVTLGEVELALGEAKERVKGMSKFYTPAWKQRGEIFIKLLEAGADKIDAITIYKKGINTDDLYAREVAPSDWATALGYRCKVWSQDEKNEHDIQSIEKLNAIRANIPGNPKLDEIYQRKLLEFGGLSPDEILAIMEFEQQKRKMMTSMAGQIPTMPGQAVQLQGQVTVPQAPMA